MKAKALFGFMVVFAAVGALLAMQGPAVRAQPVANITLPAPGGSVQLYAGCNNIALTFPDGTPSQQVVQAVTPAGAVESLWRHSALMGRFEGFNPAFPGASDLLSVDFLDAAWLCMAEAPPGAAMPPPPPAALTADLEVGPIYAANMPQGDVLVVIRNNGPDNVVNESVDLGCTSIATVLASGLPSPPIYAFGPIIVNLAPFTETVFPTGHVVDTNQATYEVTCDIQPPFTDPNPANNGRTDMILAGAMMSDRNLKEDVLPVDEREVLARLADIPITTWSYRAEDPDIRHMGPMAQDFRAAFGLGENDTTISIVDAGGVALAAIQGLHQLSQEQSTRIAALEATNASLQDQLDGLEAPKEGEGVSSGLADLLSSGVPVGWLLLGGLGVAGVVLAQRWLKARGR